jgi:thioredoxin-dependent peroxiredoxin
VVAAYGIKLIRNKFPSRWTIYIGKDGKILKIDKKVKSKTHGKDVAKALKELGVGEK